jgi:hypothetical protein
MWEKKMRREGKKSNKTERKRGTKRKEEKLGASGGGTLVLELLSTRPH